ncbi:O-antigen ligase [Tessaracoccus sp. ZS01]|uniref:O-antigen ligase family protein n=2 Tax=Tessaracoccus sp. ZS01 TaxID=1906324 RepID=UPI0013017883|nr:O-antigen ligase family protein [Tessaracoccus sp. ZS01]
MAARFWIAYTAWMLMAVCWTVTSVTASMTSALGVVLLTAVLVLMAQLPFNSHDYWLIRRSWTVMAIFAAAMFFAFGEQSRLGARTHLVLESGGSDPNEFSAYLILPLAYFVESSITAGGTRRLLAAASTVGSIYIIVLTGSRAGVIAALVVILIVSIRQAGRGIRNLAIVGTVGAVCTLIVSEYVWPLVPESVRARLSIEALVQDRGSLRADIWKSGVDLVASSDFRFIVGFGPNGAPLDHHVMHNHFLQVLVDGGVIGLLLFLGIILTALRASWCSVPIFAATVGVTIMMTTLTAYSNFRPAWAVLFMALLISSVRKSHEGVSPKGSSPHRLHAEWTPVPHTQGFAEADGRVSP